MRAPEELISEESTSTGTSISDTARNDGESTSTTLNLAQGTASGAAKSAITTGAMNLAQAAYYQNESLSTAINRAGSSMLNSAISSVAIKGIGAAIGAAGDGLFVVSPTAGSLVKATSSAAPLLFSGGAAGISGARQHKSTGEILKSVGQALLDTTVGMAAATVTTLYTGPAALVTAPVAAKAAVSGVHALEAYLSPDRTIPSQWESLDQKCIYMNGVSISSETIKVGCVQNEEEKEEEDSDTEQDWKFVEKKSDVKEESKNTPRNKGGM